MSENHEKPCFTFFAFLPPYIGVSDSLVSRRRKSMKRSIDWYKKLLISRLVARYSAVFVFKSMEIHGILWWILVVIGIMVVIRIMVFLRIMVVIRIMGVVGIIGVMDPWIVDLWTMDYGLTDYGPWDYVLWDSVLWRWYGSMFKCKVFYVR